MVEHRTFNPMVPGSSPGGPTKQYGSLTQMARDLPFKQSDDSSMLSGPTIQLE